MANSTPESQNADADASARQGAKRFANAEANEKAFVWLKDRLERLQDAVENSSIARFLLEPFAGLFGSTAEGKEDAIRQTITLVAVANMVLAGLPGKLGVGVFVSMALEMFMAYRIGQLCGLPFDSPKAMWKWIGGLAATGFGVFFLFKEALNVAFSLFNTVGVLPATVFSQLVTTNLFGVIFWAVFKSAKEGRKAALPKRLIPWILKETKALVKHQYTVVRKNLTVTNLKTTGARLKDWLAGNITPDTKSLRGEIFSTAAVALLLSAQSAEDLEAHFEGPLGSMWIKAVRLRVPSLSDASVEEIAAHVRDSYVTPEQIRGFENLIQGKFFELRVAAEARQDNWQAVLHTDESFPGSDIRFYDSDNTIREYSIKSSAMPDSLEAALVKYPEIPILATTEAAMHFGGDPRVVDSGLSGAENREINSANLDALLANTPSADVSGASAAAMGVTAGVLSQLWPFTVARLRGNISQAELSRAYTHILGESGKALASRMAWAVVFGPLFAWALLARGTIALTQSAQEQAHAPQVLQFEWKWRD